MEALGYHMAQKTDALLSAHHSAQVIAKLKQLQLMQVVSSVTAGSKASRSSLVALSSFPATDGEGLKPGEGAWSPCSLHHKLYKGRRTVGGEGGDADSEVKQGRLHWSAGGSQNR